KHLVDGSDEFREIDAEGGVGDRVLQQREHDQAGHDERAVVNPFDRLDPCPDRRAEDDEVKGGRKDGGYHALEDGPAHAGHFIEVNCLDRLEIHRAASTKLTKISSSELCFVLRSFTVMPERLRSASSEPIPVREACVS